MKDQKFDLSDPNPQLATFMHHFQALPDKFVSPAMACLILLFNLLLTTNPGQESVYQCMLETEPASVASTLCNNPTKGLHMTREKLQLTSHSKTADAGTAEHRYQGKRPKSSVL